MSQMLGINRGNRMSYLLNKQYFPTSIFGHFGRDDSNFSWEQIDKVDILREEAF